MQLLSWLCVSLLVVASACAPTGVRAPTEDPTPILRAQTQAMMDAIGIGDRKVWDRLLDPDVTYLSEAGVLENKAQLLKELDPLPAGISGHIEFSKFDVKHLGDLAVVYHADEEYENYFGTQIHAQYLCLSTWRYRDGMWKLLSEQVYASLLDPPAITLPADQLDDYVGTYQLTDQIHYTIRRDGDHLVGQRDSKPATPLAIEARDVMFVAGQPRSRKIFGRDASGKVTRFVDRREARDIVWTRAAGGVPSGGELSR